MRIFGYDGFFAQAARYLGRLLLLNFCFLLCCIPVFTIGAACAALYSVSFRQADEDSAVLDFFRAFKSNFRQATLIFLIFLAIGGVLGVSLYFLLSYEIPAGGVFRVLVLLLLVLCCSARAFVFPLQARYHNSVRQTVKNAFVLGTSLLLHGLVMSCITFLPCILFFVDAELRVFLFVFSIWGLAGFAMSARINAGIACGVFRKIQPEESGAAQADTASEEEEL